MSWTMSKNVIVLLVSIISYSASVPFLHAGMAPMSDSELSEITGAGFSQFTLTDGIARAWFNITTETFTEIESLKLGYYDDGSTTGWDQDWEGVSLGSSTEDLVLVGLYLEAGFSNISDPATRTLNYLKIGSTDMTGPISANFISFSGSIKDSGGNFLVNGHRVTTLGQRTIYSNSDEFYLKLEQSGTEKGWWAHWEDATITP